MIWTREAGEKNLRGILSVRGESRRGFRESLGHTKEDGALTTESSHSKPMSEREEHALIVVNPLNGVYVPNVGRVRG